MSDLGLKGFLTIIGTIPIIVGFSAGHFSRLRMSIHLYHIHIAIEIPYFSVFSYNLKNLARGLRHILVAE